MHMTDLPHPAVLRGIVDWLEERATGLKRNAGDPDEVRDIANLLSRKAAAILHDPEYAAGPVRSRGTREEMIEAVELLREGWGHLGRPDLAREAGSALHDLQRGASKVRVGQSEYVVNGDL